MVLSSPLEGGANLTSEALALLVHARQAWMRLL
jgi:hypothetical protein